MLLVCDVPKTCAISSCLLRANVRKTFTYIKKGLWIIVYLPGEYNLHNIKFSGESVTADHQVYKKSSEELNEISTVAGR